MDYDLIVVKTLERVYKNYYYIIRGAFTMAKVFITLTGTNHYDDKGHKTGHSNPGILGGWNHYDD